MLAVPNKPQFTLVDVTPLDAVDWTNDRAAAAVVRTLQVAVEGNSQRLANYSEAALAASKERVTEMQKSLSFGKKAGKDTSLVNTDAALKQARDEVKQMMGDSADIVRDYDTAMKAWRGKVSFDSAGKFANALKDIRSKVQNADKAASPVPSQIRALEGAASGLIKEIRGLRDAIGGNLERRAKLLSAAEKFDKMALDAKTHVGAIGSALESFPKYLKDVPTFAKDIKTRVIDIDSRYKKYYTSMVAVQALKHAMESLQKGFEGHGFAEGVKTEIKAAEAAWDALIKKRDEVDKQLQKLRKEKALPKADADKLPKDLKGHG